MNKITAIVIAKNEQNLIRDCIDSLSFCDEIVLIDNGSKDKTKDIAESLGAKVYEINSNDFSEVRNFGLGKANNDWILYIDADERVSENLRKEIEKGIISSKFGSYLLKRKNFYLGNNEWPYIEKMLRLFKKENISAWRGQLHETPIVTGEIGVLEGNLLHYTHRDLESMVNKTIAWSSIEAAERFKQNHPKMSWWRFPRVMVGAFLNSYIIQGGYRAKTVGIIESVYQAFSIFITYAKLWEMQNLDKHKNGNS